MSVYLAAIQDRDPRLRRARRVGPAGDSRHESAAQLASAALDRVRSTESAAVTLERVLGAVRADPRLARDRTVPEDDRRACSSASPRSTLPVTHPGALGRSVSWAAPPGRPVDRPRGPDDFKHGAGDRAASATTTTARPTSVPSPIAEVEADRAGPALLLVGSSGTLIVTVNEQPVYQYNNTAGRGYAPDTDLVRLDAGKGRNRILVVEPARDRGLVFRAPDRASSSRALVPAPARGRRRSKTCAASPWRTRAIPRREKRSSSTRRESAASRCHAAAGTGNRHHRPRPDRPGAKYDRAEVIRSVLEPSNRIATGYQPVIVATRDGKVETGVVRSETDTTLELADSEARITTIPKARHRGPPRGRSSPSCRRSRSRRFRPPSLLTLSAFCSSSSSRRSGETAIQMNESQETVSYTERMVPEGAHARIFWEHVARYRFAKDFVRGKRVLDIACGEGYGAAALAKAGAASVVGVDLSPDVCDHARQKYGIDARPGDAQAIPLPDRSIDLVVSFETIEHVADPGAFLRECARVLVREGMLIVSTPNRPVYSPEGTRNPFHRVEFDEREFVELLESRLQTVRIYTQFPQTAAWWSHRSLAAERSPWLRDQGFLAVIVLVVSGDPSRAQSVHSRQGRRDHLDS